MKYTALERKAYGEGLRAARAGLDTIACTYKPDSDCGKSWFNGYRAGKWARRNPVADYVASGLGEDIDFCPSDNS